MRHLDKKVTLLLKMLWKVSSFERKNPLNQHPYCNANCDKTFQFQCGVVDGIILMGWHPSGDFYEEHFSFEKKPSK